MKCECGKEIDKEGSFCKYCGKKFENDNEWIDRMIDKIKEITKMAETNNKVVNEQIKMLSDALVMQNKFYEENPEIHKKFIEFCNKTKKKRDKRV